MICPYCQNEHPDTAQFCPVTGGKLAQAGFCQNCGNKVEPGWRVCGYCGQALPGQAMPAQAAPTTQPAGYPYYPAYAAPKRRRGLNCLIDGLIGMAALVGILLLVDSFTLHGLGRLTGRYDAAAAALPADSMAYIGVNFLNATPQKLERFTQAFDGISLHPASRTPRRALVLAAPDQQSGDDPVSLILSALQDELGLTIPDDLTPWAGQFGGLAYVPSEIPGESLVVAVEARSPSKADSFLRQWAARLEQTKNLEYSQENYRGVNIYVPDSDHFATFGRSGWTVMVAWDRDALRYAIDQQKQGSTLMKDSAFQGLLRQAPASRTATVFVDGRSIEQLADESDPDTAFWLPLSNLFGMDIRSQPLLATFTIIGEGLQMDLFSNFVEGQATSDTVDVLESFRQFSPQTAAYLPADTQLFYTAPGLELLNRLFDGLMGAAGGGSSEEFYKGLDEMVGFRPDRDLGSAGNQDWAFGAALNDLSQAPTGLVEMVDWYLAVETQDIESVRQLAERMTAGVEAEGVSTDQKRAGQNGYYQVNLSQIGGPDFSYAYSPQALVLTLGGEIADLEAILGDEQNLAGNPRYTQTWSAFPGDMAPLLYLDVDAFYQKIEAAASDLSDLSYEYRLLKPVQRIAAAIQVDAAYQTHLRLVAFLQQP